jgi:hypothetical protein
MATHTVKSRIALCIGLAFAGVPAALGEPEEEVHCIPGLSNTRTPVKDASLPAAWCSGKFRSFHVVATTGPYRVSDYALKRLRAVMDEQVGLRFDVTEGKDTGLPPSGILSPDKAVRAGWEQIPEESVPTVAIVVVEETRSANAKNGFIRYWMEPRPTAVMVLHRGPISAMAIGGIPVERIEATVVVHEIGHWLRVPARDFHRARIDPAHCTNARCVMYKGLSANTPCVIKANLLTGIPLRFGPECAEELREMWRQRDQNRRE